MKRSTQVPLILLGALTTLAGCNRADLPAKAQQGCYATLQDCRDDWGDTGLCKQAPAVAVGSGAANPCTSTSRSSSGSHGAAGFIGPRYYWDRNAGRPMVIEDGKTSLAKSGAASRGAPEHAASVHSVSVSRGGFGAHGGGGHGSGGG
jgi:hypothetical protein